jgi:hypothetical protein
VLTVVATSILSGREPFIRIGVVLSVLALLSNFLTFAIATLLVLLVVVAVWLMRRSSRGGEAFPAVSAP